MGRDHHDFTGEIKLVFLPFLELADSGLSDYLSSSDLLGKRHCFAVMHEARYDASLCPRPLLFVFEKKETDLQFCVIDVSHNDVGQLQGKGIEVNKEYLERYLKSGVEYLSLNSPWYLQPCSIKKPWGQEIWYSAMEARGVCRFASSSHGSPEGLSQSSHQGAPIPWVLELSSLIFGAADKLNLLKILAPHNHPNFGELYFELHQYKQEVYVVSHVDKTAWPGGVGQMRFGFCPKKLAQYQSFETFKSDYLWAAKQYSNHRAEIDELLSGGRALRGGADDDNAAEEILSLECKIKLREELPQALLQKEATLYESLNEFVGVRELSLGDVVKVPKNFPHSLMHGVRVVEFQTPVYERMILSFNQKVLTQEHWDTEAALALLSEAPKAPEQAAYPEDLSGVSIQTIVEFEDFLVKRLNFHESTQLCWETLGLDADVYSLIMSLGSNVTLLPAKGAVLVEATSHWALAAEQSVFLRAGLAVDFTAAAGDVVLICQPNIE